MLVSMDNKIKLFM